MSMRRSARSRRPPPRLDSGGDQAAVQQAIRISLQQQQRVVRDIPEATTLSPTEAEFSDFGAYIKTIAPDYAQEGIVKIILPERWRPIFNLEIMKEFETFKQALHHLQEGAVFESGGVYDQNTFKKYAEGCRLEWLARHPDVAGQLGKAQARGDEASVAATLEEEYWRIVERASEEEVFIDYANNLDTKKFGTPFRNSSASRPWDLSSLGHHPLNIQKRVGTRIAGVTSPWLYFGALFTTFCWHIEDHFLYSANYLHNGASKTWYGIPEPHAKRFEDVVRRSFPHRFKKDPDLLHQLVMMVSPSYLLSQGVPVKKIIQKPGQLVVSFPRAYHSGFSHGWNCAEAVNFALMDWLPIGQKAVASYRSLGSGRSPTFSHDQLVWDLCQDALASANNGTPWPHKSSVDVPADDRLILYNEFNALVERELGHRGPVRSAGFLEFQVQKAWDGEPFQCIICKNMHYLSFCVCPCRKQAAGTLCLEHFLEATCPCKNSSKVLCIQVPDADLLKARDALWSITKGTCGQMAPPLPQVIANGHMKQDSDQHNRHVVPSVELSCHGADRDGETSGRENAASTTVRGLDPVDSSGAAQGQVHNSRYREAQTAACEGYGAEVDKHLASNSERRKRLGELQSPKTCHNKISTGPAMKKLRSS